MKRNLLNLIMLLCISLQVFAYDFSVVNSDGKTIYYNITSSTTVGVTYKYIDNDNNNTYYTGVINIPESVTYDGNTYSVTSIGDSTFHRCSDLTSVTIGNSVTSIGYKAFHDCSDLTSVTIGNSVTSIRSSAFQGCSSLTTLNWNAKNCTSVGYGYSSHSAFDNLTNLTQVNIGDSVEVLPPYFLDGCIGLTSVTIPSSVTSIGDGAFGDCDSLTSVNYLGTIADWCNINFTTGRSNPLHYAHNLSINGQIVTEISIPAISQIKSYAFSGYRGLTSVTIGNSVTSIGDGAFEDCRGLTSITIPNSVTSIGVGAFDGCSGLTSVTIPNSVTSIGAGAFFGCRGLTSIIIPNSVTTIPALAFSCCFGLTSITIPNSVTSIGGEAFSQCPLDTLRMKPENPPTISEFGFGNPNVILVPCGRADVYKSATNWDYYYAYKIQEDCSVGLEEVVKETGIAVYPNPVMDNAVLSIDNLKEDVKVILTDEQGRQVSLSTMKAGEREINLNTNSLSNGIYFLRIVGETIQRTEKIIKK